MKQKFKLALAQVCSKREGKAENIEKIRRTTLRAKRLSADLVVFPELSLTGYTIRDQVYELAETIPGASTRIIEDIARKAGTHIIFGMPELSEKTHATIYNSAVLTGPNGMIGKYRKLHLPTHSIFEEKRYFRPGYRTTVLDSQLGKIGLVICYDLFFPEVVRLTRLNGAKLIVCISASPAVRKSFFEVLTAARAIENTVFLAYVNTVGIEDGLQFWGGSRLVGPQGNILAKAKYDEEDLVIAEVDYSDLRVTETFVPTLKDLRPELFDELRKSAEEL